MSDDRPKLKLKKVTPRALKVYKKHGLLNFKASDIELAEKTFDVFMNEKALAEILEISFVKDFSQENLDDIDLAMVSQGIQDFLAQLSSYLRT